MARATPKADVEDNQRRLAVLIDADNAQPAIIEGLLAEVAKFGVASVKRIYGDWTSTNMSGWKRALLAHSLMPMQQFPYTSGKNATDSSLIIDAMDLLHSDRFDGFCLVSSDSDFTRLAQRLREAGLVVYGFGEKKTPEAFRQACDRFVYTEVLRPAVPAVDASIAAKPSAPAPPAKARGPATLPGRAAKSTPKVQAPAPPAVATPAPRAILPMPVALIRQAIEEESDESGWAGLGAVGSYLVKVKSDFDARNFGHKKLSDLLRSAPDQFQVEDRGGSGPTKAVYVRLVA
jgi:hypothetical protein